MAVHITQHRDGFGPGLTEITRPDEAEDNTGIGVAVLRLKAGERQTVLTAGETAWLMMSGDAEVEFGDGSARLRRASLFDQGPSCIHLSAGEKVEFKALADSEFTVYRAPNRQRFPGAIHLPADVPDEQRGKGQVGDACLRLVRTIFDRSNTQEACELVLGEVVTLPGRWSSYPPHHHPQPEIYHYRFDPPQGYGHAELGERVLKVRHNDTVKISGGQDHPQCAAPGYAMYYSWVIRHLPGKPYTVPEFDPTHRWTMEKGARFWQPALSKPAEK